MSLYTELLQAGYQKQNYLSKLSNPEPTQRQVLNDLLLSKLNTSFGKFYNLSSVSSYESFSKQVQLFTYDQMDPWIQRIFEGDSNSLTDQRPDFFEITSGTSSKPKIIPYTQGSLKALQHGLNYWLGSLLESRPQLREGKHYWSISPAATSQRPSQKDGYKIGIENDALYFGPQIAQSILETLAVSPEVSKIKDPREWRISTLTQLVSSRSLSFISIWSPTFILELLRNDNEHDHEIWSQVISRSNLSQHHKEQIKDNLNNSSVINTQFIWPNLDTISVWLDGSAKHFESALRKLFPRVYFQGKGLLSTEALISIPLDSADPMPALESSFLEFKGSDGFVLPLWKIKPHTIYEVIVTTAGGLTRYQTCDLIRTGTQSERGLGFRFIGRSNLSVDLVGEKITENFVIEQLAGFAGFGFLAPSLANKPHYCFYVDTLAEQDLNERDLDQALSLNPHYAYARSIGQLDRIKFVKINQLAQKYVSIQTRRGQLIGDIKPPRLRTELQWTEWLK